MIPLGYMYKRISKRPDWLGVTSVVDIYSASECISKNFCDYIPYWKHNGFWLFNSPSVIEHLADEQTVSLDGCTLFYYEAYEHQFLQDEKEWADYSPIKDFETKVVVPPTRRLEGYDVSTFLCGNKPECSPLSCNYLARELPVNAHCLFANFEEANCAIDSGKFEHSEPGPLRILAVYSITN